MATPSPVNWRAVGAAAGLVLTFDVVLVLFVVSAAADHAYLLPMLNDPTAPKAVTAKPAVAAPPAAVRFKRRDARSDEELCRQLFAVPELDLDTQPGTGARISAAARRGSSRFTEPVLEPLLARADLQGLPVTLDGDCRLGKESAQTLQVQSRDLRRHLSECMLGGAPNAVLLRPRLLEGADDQGHRKESVPTTALRNLSTPRPEDDQWYRDERVPALVQMLQAEDQPVRLLLVQLLDRTPGRRASAALAGRAVFDLSDEVREAAVRALAGRPRDEYRGLLLDGLRYPWRPAADHAAEALVALGDRDSLPRLTALLDEPDPARPALRTCRDIDPELLLNSPWPREAWPTAVRADGGPGSGRRTGLLPYPDDVPGRIEALTGRVTVVREVVRVNHLRNCLLCHAASFDQTDSVRGLVPSPEQPLPPPFSTAYYEGQGGTSVRADVTYLRQDFSVPQPVANPGNWPAYQRYDYLVRTRYATAEELRRKEPATYPQREAVRWALRELGAKEG